MYKCYPNAKRAHLKSGGNFPYLSRSAEVNIFIQVQPPSPPKKNQPKNKCFVPFLMTYYFNLYVKVKY